MINLEKKRRGVPLIALGALTGVTAGTGIECSIGSIFGAGGSSTKNRVDIDFALQNLKKMKTYGSQFKANLLTKSIS